MLVIAATCSALGCANLATNSTKSGAKGITEDITNDAATAPVALTGHRGLIDDAHPLTADKAVQIALVNNQNLAAVYAELGFAKAEVFAGARIRNPLLSFSQLDSNAGIDQIVWGISTSLTDLITLRSRKKLAATQALAIEQKVQAYAMVTQALTYQHYYQYLASKQRLQVLQEISAISDLILEATQRYSDAGNVTALELAEAKIQSSKAKLELLDAQAGVFTARTEMSEILGVRVSQNWQIAKQLPVPDAASLYRTDNASGKIPTKDTLVQRAREQRLDLQAAQTEIAALTLKLKSHSLENKVGDIALGAERERESDGERLTGPNVEWAVPLFSQGQEDQLKIIAELEIAQAQLRQLALELDNGIALALAGRENSTDKIIQYQSHLLPAQANAVARTQEKQFFMLIGVFEVLRSKKNQYESLLGLVDAVEEYWLASIALAKAVGVSPKVFIAQSDNGSRGIEDYLQPAPGTDSPKKSHKPQHHGMHKPQPGPAGPTHANDNQAPDNHASHKNRIQSASAKP